MRFVGLSWMERAGWRAADGMDVFGDATLASPRPAAPPRRPLASSPLPYDGAVGAAASAFSFLLPLRYSTFRLYFAAASGSLAWRARVALMMFLMRK